MYQGILQYKKSRYAWWALVLIVAASLTYWLQSDLQPPNGGTIQGYVLGTVGALIIVWLSYLGIVKRRYSGARVQAWTSAHVYLGLALLIVASLHSALQLGFNVHSLAYVLMCLVIVSGMVGMLFYLRYPQQLARNRPNVNRQQLFAELSRLNEEGQSLANRCDVSVRRSVDTAIARTGIGGNLIDQLFGRDTSSVVMADGNNEEKGLKPVANVDQAVIIDFVSQCVPRARKQDETSCLQELLAVLCRRQAVTRQIREDIKLQARLKAWLWVHVPCTIGLLIALSIHIVSVFFYW